MTSFLNTAHDDRLDAGMTVQAARIRAAEAAGGQQTGWKAGFGTKAGRSGFGLDAPLVGALLEATRLRSGATVAIGTWTAPRAEGEIALRLGSDVAGDATPEEALAAVDAVGPAIELVDLFPAPVDPATVIADGLYHRHWVTGVLDTARAGGDLTGLVGVVHAMGSASDPVTDLEAANGPAGEVLAEVARMGARHGRPLRAGDIVILGSIVPPSPVAPGETFRFELSGHPAIEVTFVV